MSATITYSGGPTLTPLSTELASVTASSDSGSVVHQILDGAPVVTLRQAGPRKGVLALAFGSAVLARDCFEAHRLATTFSLTSTSASLPSFRYVVDGAAEIESAETGVWRVKVPYQEVS